MYAIRSYYALLLLSSHSFADDTNFVNASLASVNFQNLIGETLNETSDQPVRIGVLANRGSDIAMEEWGPTAEYLVITSYSIHYTKLYELSHHQDNENN